MNEQELMNMMSEAANRNWEIWQYWTGVSFGYIILAYVAARH
jgi:ABC-type amino acid transport system permease subunit